MAKLDLSGMDYMEAWLDHVSEVPRDVKADMLNAMADTVVRAQKEEAQALLQGPYNQGAVVASIKKNKPLTEGTQPQIKVSFEGEQHGNRLGEIAFVNEYGKVNQPARPFIMIANAKSETEVVAEAAKIFLKFMEG